MSVKIECVATTDTGILDDYELMAVKRDSSYVDAPARCILRHRPTGNMVVPVFAGKGGLSGLMYDVPYSRDEFGYCSDFVDVAPPRAWNTYEWPVFNDRLYFIAIDELYTRWRDRVSQLLQAVSHKTYEGTQLGVDLVANELSFLAEHLGPKHGGLLAVLALKVLHLEEHNVPLAAPLYWPHEQRCLDADFARMLQLYPLLTPNTCEYMLYVYTTANAAK